MSKMPTLHVGYTVNKAKKHAVVHYGGGRYSPVTLSGRKVAEIQRRVWDPTDPEACQRNVASYRRLERQLATGRELDHPALTLEGAAVTIDELKGQAEGSAI